MNVRDKACSTFAASTYHCVCMCMCVDRINVLHFFLILSPTTYTFFLIAHSVVIYYNHLQERIKMGAAELAMSKDQAAQQKEKMASELETMRNALLMQQQELARQQLELAEKNIKVAQREAEIARAQVEIHSGDHENHVSVEAQITNLVNSSDVATAQLTADVEKQKALKQQRLQQRLKEKRERKKGHARNADMVLARCASINKSMI